MEAVEHFLWTVTFEIKAYSWTKYKLRVVTLNDSFGEAEKVAREAVAKFIADNYQVGTVSKRMIININPKGSAYLLGEGGEKE